MLISKCEGVYLEEFNNSKTFIEYPNDMGRIYGNIEKCNPDKKCKTLIIFADIIANTFSNKKT